MAKYLRAMSVGGLIDHELPGPGSAAGYSPSVHVLPLVLMLAGGGRTLEDLRVLRGDEGLRSLLHLDGMLECPPCRVVLNHEILTNFANCCT
jgi:hypothetical protein